MTTSRRTWVTRLVGAFAVWLVICVVAFLLGNQPSPGLIALVMAAGAGTFWLYLDTSAQSEPPRWQLTSDEPVRPRGEDPRLALLHRVVSQHLVSRDPTDQLHRYVGEVIDRHLVAEHGFSRSTDPERAARVLGPELSGLLEQTRSRRLSLSQIDQLLSRIEML